MNLVNNKKTFLITGGAGFIGSNLANHLSKNNKIIIIDDLSSGKKENLHKNKNIYFYKKKIQNLKKIKKIDGIFHLSAQSSVNKSFKNTYQSCSDNILGSIRIFEIAKKLKIPIIYASSAAIYGNQVVGSDKDGKMDPLSPYAADKMYLEKISKIFFNKFKLPSIGFRFFNVYGPNQFSSNYSGVISVFINNLFKNKKTYINGGNQTRDFIFVKDIVQILDLFMNFIIEKKIMNEIYNVGTGKQVSINQVLKYLCKINKRKIKPIKKNYIVGDPKHSKGDFKKIMKILNKHNFNFTKLEKGLEITSNNS